MDLYLMRLWKLIKPVPHVFNITPNDNNILEHSTTAISFAVAGTLRIETVGGELLTIPQDSLAAGVQHTIQVKKVFSTGTTATGIVGYW